MVDQLDSRRRLSRGELQQELSVKDLISSIKWQRIQDDLSSITGISMRTVAPEGQILTQVSNPPRLCDIIKSTSTGRSWCGNCLPTFLGGKKNIDRNFSYSCLSGISCFVIPLKLHKPEQKLVANIIFGPVVLVLRKSKEQYQRVAEELGLELDVFWDALLELEVISFSKSEMIIKLIKDIAEYVIDLSYKNLELGSYMTLNLNELSSSSPLK